MKLTAIKQRNSHFASENHEGRVCVFVGATSGIGASTLEKMLPMLGVSTIYVAGRSETQFESQSAKLESLNENCKIVFLETDVSLLSGIDAACKKISAMEKKVDILYMSAGLVPLNGPECMSSHTIVLHVNLTHPQIRKKGLRLPSHFRITAECE